MVQNTVKGKKSSTKKITKVVPKGRLYVRATFNNTLVSITDDKGGVLCLLRIVALPFTQKDEHIEQQINSKLKTQNHYCPVKILFP